MSDPNDTVAAFLRTAVPEVAADYHRANTATTGLLSGEKLLMIAVMRDALDALNGRVTAGTYTPSKIHAKNARLMKARKEQITREARRWFASEDDSWPFSFVSICDYLGLDTQAVRAEIRKRAEE